MQLKIQFGKLKGKVLRYHDDHDVRPSLARARDVLFNWIPRCDNMSCLDLFAGTGILGLQAYSLGAKSVLFIDLKEQNKKNILEHVRKIDALDVCSVLCKNAIDWLFENQSQYDLIFLDPPFDEGWLDKILLLNDFQRCVHPHTLIYLEAERGWKPPLLWNIYKQKNIANVSIYLLTPILK
jgi:16S rRNA (guanine(966)-N(2))-methyltransferase RsmD